MQEEFHLNQRLKNDSYEILDLSLSKLLLVNNSLFPWVMLVPKKNDMKEIIDLNEEDRIILMKEISLVSEVMKEIFQPNKLNVATLGNIVEQLHIHIIARYKKDKSWPLSVWTIKEKKYSKSKLQNVLKKLRKEFNLKR